MKIKVKCHTNVDEGRTKKWPEEMACRPQKGDHVRSKDGFDLVVYKVTHCISEDLHKSNTFRYEEVPIPQYVYNDPYLEVELVRNL